MLRALVGLQAQQAAEQARREHEASRTRHATMEQQLSGYQAKVSVLLA